MQDDTTGITDPKIPSFMAKDVTNGAADPNVHGGQPMAPSYPTDGHDGGDVYDDRVADTQGDEDGVASPISFDTELGDNLTMCDISNEDTRVYFYPDGSMVNVAMPDILYFKTEKRQDSHRVLGKDGWVTYIPAGWTHFRWKPSDPTDPVQF